MKSSDTHPEEQHETQQTEYLPAVQEERQTEILDARPGGDILELAVRQNLDVASIERLVALVERREEKAAERALWDALAAAQGAFPPIEKTRVVKNKNGGIAYKYASLDDLIAVISPILSENGLSFSFEREFKTNDNGVLYEISSSLVLHHSAGGQHQFPPVVVPVDDGYMSTIQKSGSSMTYADRYAFQGGLGIRPCDEDTDGAPAPEPSRQASSPRRASESRQEPQQTQQTRQQEAPPAQPQDNRHPAADGWAWIKPDETGSTPYTSRKGTGNRYWMRFKHPKTGADIYASTFSETLGKELLSLSTETWIRMSKNDKGFITVEEIDR